MALYHKWDVKNGFAYALTFFSLISNGLGGVACITLKIKLLWIWKVLLFSQWNFSLCLKIAIIAGKWYIKKTLTPMSCKSCREDFTFGFYPF